MARKKVHGEGTVFKRKNGRLVGEFADGETGKVHTVYGKTEDECWQKMAEKKVALAREQALPNERMTVAEWSDEWLLYKVNYRDQSYSHRRSVIRNYIKPLLGHLQLQKLRAHHIQKLFVAKMIESGLEPSTIASYFGALHAMCEAAVLRDMLIKNPCEHIALPEVRHIPRSIISLEEFDLFLAEMGDMALMAEFAAYTAMRLGEICALRWKHVHFEERSLFVCETVAWISKEKRFVVGPPKTDSSKRWLALPQCAMDLLFKIHAEQKADRVQRGFNWNPLGLVFPRGTGEYIFGGTVNRKVKRVVRRLGLPEDFTFHGLRHLAVATLIKAGAHPKMIQEICGHSSIKVTMDLYGHLFEGMHREAMNLLDNVFLKARERKKA